MAEKRQKEAEEATRIAEEAREAEAEQTELARVATIRAQDQALNANRQERSARLQTSTAEANAAKTFFLANQPLEGMVAALKAWQILKAEEQDNFADSLSARIALIQSAYQSTGNPMKNRIINQNLPYGFREKNSFLGSINGQVTLSFSPDNSTFLSSDGVNGTVLWNMNGTQSTRLNDIYADSIVRAPSGEMFLAVVSADGITLRDFKGSQVDTLNFSEQVGSRFRGAFFSSTSQILALLNTRTFSEIKLLDIWNLDNSELKTLEPLGRVSNLAVSSDGSIVAASTFRGIGDKDIKVQVRYQEEIPFIIPVYNGVHISSLAFNPEGNILAISEVDGPIKLWDVERLRESIWNDDLSFRPLTTLEGHRSSVLSMAFSPDG